MNMRGRFFIIKGHYVKGAEPSFTNEVTNSVNHIGGYDPYSPDTKRWFMLIDNKTYRCLSCSSDIKKVLEGVYKVIKHYKGDLKRYEKHISAEKVSPPMRCIYEQVYKEYGHYYSDEVTQMEDLAYGELKEERPVHKNKKLVKTIKKEMDLVKKEDMVFDTTTPKKVMPKTKIGVKKLPMV